MQMHPDHLPTAYPNVLLAITPGSGMLPPMKDLQILRLFNQLMLSLSIALTPVQAAADEVVPPLQQAPSATASAAPASALDKEPENAALASRNAILLSPTVQFKNTVGTPAYYQEAFEHHCRNAKTTGDANSYYVMGWQYANGRGMKRDLALASAMLTKAAEAGHPKARGILEVMPPVDTPPEMPACLRPDPPPPRIEIAALPEVVPDFYERDGKIHQLVSRLAPEFGIDINLAMAVIAVESGFNPRATSPKNAQGLMQLIPDTARRFQVRNPYDPEDNVKGGLAYLRWLMTQFEGNVELVAAAYNAGEKAVEKYRGIPPYPETRNYVQKVVGLYRKTTHPYQDHLGRTVNMTAP